MEANRTFVGSVVCVDLVGYSKRSVAVQEEIKAAFNKLLMQALRKVAPEDRIILDTGDGAAISFLGDPEECLAIGLKLRDTMNGAASRLGGAEPEGGPVRIGINLGPLRVAEDMNGRPKIIGDGINVAEKICTFAKPGQIVVSRPFHDMVSRISDKHREIFNYEGVRTDRNVRDHEIYSVIPAVAEVPLFAKSKTLPPVPPPKVEVTPAPAGDGASVPFLRDPKKWGTAAVILAGIVVWELAVVAGRTGTPPAAPAPEPPRVAEAPKKVEPPKVVEPPKKAEPPKVVEIPKPEPAKKVEPKPEPPKVVEAPKKAEPPKAVEPPKPEPAKKVEPKPEPPKAPPVIEKKAPERKAEEPARVIPSPRTPPATVAPAVTPAPSMQPTEPVQTIREEPKPTPPPPAPPTTVATPVSRAPVSFPVAAINRGIAAGTVRARLTINAAGAVTGVEIIAADPPQVFNRAATTSLEAWKFNPGADKRTYEIEIEFKR